MIFRVVVAALLTLTGKSTSDQGGPHSSVGRCLADTKPRARWTVPAAYRELSGLALSADGRLFFHNDELGLIGALDPTTGQMLGSYQLGTSLVRADFEGIAVTTTEVVMVSSDGVLFRAPLPPRDRDRGALPATAVATGLGRQCEIEGLAIDPGPGDLLLACKSPRAKALKNQVAVFRWSLAAGALAAPAVFPRKDLARGRPGKDFHPSAMEVDPRTGDWILLSSADQAVAVVDRTGRVIESRPLRKGHRQPEGLAIGPDGTVYVGDEGGKGPGTITVYDCR